jgi:cyclophilin family peptidyl-prolyl cis-trans isomerase
MLKTVICGLAVAGILFAFSPNTQAEENTIEVIMKTTQGDMTIELFPDKAPITVENFLSYVDEKFYDGTIFHRVISNFMIQGGGWTADFVKKPTHDPITNEAANGLSNKKYTLALGRTMEPHSAAAQFYINLKYNSHLDHQNTTDEGYGYCVFGRVISGQEVVDTIGNMRTMTRQGMQDVPRETVEIISVQRK